MEFHYFRFQQGFGIGVFSWSCSLLFHSSYLTDEIGDIFWNKSLPCWISARVGKWALTLLVVEGKFWGYFTKEKLGIFTFYLYWIKKIWNHDLNAPQFNAFLETPCSSYVYLEILGKEQTQSKSQKTSRSFDHLKGPYVQFWCVLTCLPIPDLWHPWDPFKIVSMCLQKPVLAKCREQVNRNRMFYRKHIRI